MTVGSFDPKAQSAEIRITPAALAHLRAQLARTGHTGVRLGVKESGCNGYMYTFDYVDVRPADDLAVAGTSDVPVYVSQSDLPLVGGTEVDYVREGLNASLKFRNPNAESHCGCGESFAIHSPTD